MERRVFLINTGKALLCLAGPSLAMTMTSKQRESRNGFITLFLCGDVMTGRGIDQILPTPSDPRLYEPFMTDARDYVALAELVHGSIPNPVDFAYIWGDSLAEFESMAPDVRIINLETSITTSGAYWPGKGINYRMHPANVSCLTSANIDCCVLANNHILDWGYAGLLETLAVLEDVGVETTGAGSNARQATTPAVLPVGGKGRVLVFAYGSHTSGVFHNWAATKNRAGVSLLTNLSEVTVKRIAAEVSSHAQAQDITVASIHWGGNWGYGIPSAQRNFAHQLIDEAGVDIVHGHSSHHAKGIEVYHGKPIIYGCGDFLNDYEGIRGHEEYRGDLALMYFVTMNPDNGMLAQLQMTPMQMHRFQLRRARAEDARWLKDMLNREGERLGTHTELMPNNRLLLRWSGA